MAYDPDHIKTCFWKRISRDPWIRSKMRGTVGRGRTCSLAEAGESAVARQITKRRMIHEKLDDGGWYINIYQCPSRKSANSAFLESVIQVDVMTPYACSNMADEILSQVIALCTSPDFTVYGGVPDLDADPGDLAPPSGFYGVGARFILYPSKETKIKRL